MFTRSATLHDLPIINAVITAAIMGWKLPERVKRLSLPSYHYDSADWQHLSMQVVETSDAGIIAVAAWEEADSRDTPEQQRGLLLHGLYVHPAAQRRGLGKQLLQATSDAAIQSGCAGVLVKAQADAESFFADCGLLKLPVENAARHYAARYWLTLNNERNSGSPSKNGSNSNSALSRSQDHTAHRTQPPRPAPGKSH